MSLFTDLKEVLTPYAQRIKGLAAADEEIKADLVNQVGVFEKIEDYCINLVADPVDLANPLPSVTGLAYSIIECSAGDVFVINAEGGDTARAWGFLDSGNHALSTAEANAMVRNLKITAPENAVKLVINDKSDSISYKIGSNLVSKTCESVGDLADLETEANTDLVSAVNEVAQRGLSDALKTALLNCFANVAWLDKRSDCYEELENALYNDIPVVRFVRNRGTSGESIIHNDKRALSELIPFVNEIPITIRLRLNTPAFTLLGKFEATDGSILTTVNAADGSAGFFFTKNNKDGIFRWSTVDDEYTFKKTGSLELSTMISGVQGKDLSNNFRLVLGDVSLLDDASSEALLPEDPISGLLEVQGRVYKVQEENFPVIEVLKGKGVSGESIIDNTKRALSEPIPYENTVPINTRISLDGSDYMYLIKFTDSNGNIIVDSNVRTPNNVLGKLYTSVGRSFEGFGTPRDELTFKESGTLAPSILGESATGQTPGGYFRITFANAAGMDESLPEAPVSGIVDVQGVKYKLVTRSE